MTSVGGTEPAVPGGKLVYWSVVLLGLALLIGLYAADPATVSFFPVCPFHAATGLHCPGCGTLRGLHQLLHGNLFAALDLNALMVVALPFIGYAFVAHGAELLGYRLPPVRVTPWLARGTVALVILFWVARNLAVSPLAHLAP